MTPSSDMDNQPPQDSSPQSVTPKTDSSSFRAPQESASHASPPSIPSGSLIAPISKDDAIRNRMLRNPHRITWTTKPVQEEMDIPRQSFYFEPPPPPSTFSAWGLPILLFGLTMFTTLWAGAFQVNTKPVTGAWDFLKKYPDSLFNGLPFAATLLGILVIHELGHYVLARIHRVPASFPLFIPGPPQFIGTFGAVIRMRSPIMKRQALFDIGVAGPIAGFLAAVIAVIIGLSYSYVVPKEHAFGLQLGEPLLLQGIAWLMFGPIPTTHDLVLHPIAFAAWFGFFVTAINLLPLGQLDGGHVAFAVFGRQQRQLAYVTVPVLLYLGFTGWPGWIVWVGMASFVGLAHPPVTDPEIGLGKGRRWVAWGALVIFIITFAPVPFSVG
ncbi:MAG: site-2 protease family protein [Nitrospirota bacterium]|nr:site-2 protease family protein [Nitrospirota bacterium]MDH5586987.1 site-2 protease family protein [Nitrospirota bacterium]MDH5773299.1 site-2 protease family protein [Nitrospirota bacterium]